MSRLDRKVRRLQRSNSQSYAVFLFIVLLLFIGVAIFVRFYVFQPVKLMDTSMSPKFKERDVTWMCKIPQCLASLDERDIVWVKLKSGETQVRNILAVPGDSIEITDKGKVTTPNSSFTWTGEDAFIQSRKMYIPKSGDTLIFSELNDVEQDYVISYLRDKGEEFLVKTTLWQGNREINIDRVGATKIANRQVSLNEIDFLPWQDRYLIEEQIRQSEPGNAAIKLKRQLFHGKIQVPAAEPDSAKQDTAKADTSVADTTNKVIQEPATSPKQAVKIYGEEITKIAIVDDCYYLICNKSTACPDSREMGYYTKSRMIGRHVAWPDKIKEVAVRPVVKRVRFARDLVVDIWTRAWDFADGKFQSIKSLFQSNSEQPKP